VRERSLKRTDGDDPVRAFVASAFLHISFRLVGF
jgi:hypothetical protein